VNVADNIDFEQIGQVLFKGFGLLSPS
jgi:hypothetical protein